MVSGFLSLLLRCCKISEGSRAAAPRGTESCTMGRNSVCPSARPPLAVLQTLLAGPLIPPAGCVQGLGEGVQGLAEGVQVLAEGGQLEGSEGQLEGSESQLEGSESQLKGSESQLEGFDGHPARSSQRGQMD